MFKKFIFSAVALLFLATSIFAQSLVGTWKIEKLITEEKGSTLVTKPALKAWALADAKKTDPKKKYSAKEIAMLDKMAGEMAKMFGNARFTFAESGDYKAVMDGETKKGTYEYDEASALLIIKDKDGDEGREATVEWNGDKLTLKNFQPGMSLQLVRATK